jgi:hypothetical protein
MQKADNGNLEKAATTEGLGDDALENVTGGRDASPGIFREPTRHPSKVFIPFGQIEFRYTPQKDDGTL